MAPNHLLRAVMPLRSSMTGSTTTSSSMTFLRPTQSSLLTSSISTRRASSTTTQQQQQPDQPQQQSPIPSAAKPPSLRAYPYTIKTGTVVSVGRMDRTVRVAHNHNTWDSYLRKNYPKTTTYLVSDPRNSLRQGDVIEFSSGFPKSRNVRHVVERIIAPFGSEIAERPAVLSREERDALKTEKRAAKWERREARRLENGGQGEGAKEHVGRIRQLILER
ncbi:hypothetical protein ASPWEDRAFT_74562, partial [Aspergillus wentii DTO 134E9]